MGDINLILGRTRSLSNTLLSGTSNPSVSPSQFGLSFLPSTGTTSKTRPNAISEFRGYCHVEPVPDVNLYYQFDTNGFGEGNMSIDYYDINDDIQSETITHSDTTNSQTNNGNLTVNAGTLVTITVNNTSFNVALTSLTIQRNGGTIFSSSLTSPGSIIHSFVINTGDTTCQVYGVVDGDDPFG
jgi:hypothetical protein